MAGSRGVLELGDRSQPAKRSGRARVGDDVT